MDPTTRAAKIREALFIRGLKLADVDRRYSLPKATASTTLREPNPKGEAALCDALGVEPRELFPDRYDSDGHRLNPQPLENYKNLPTMRQRRSERAA